MSISTMRASRNSARVALINYATIRGKNPTRLICVFEGLEDLPYYETIFTRTINSSNFASLIAKGKDQVLELREILKKQQEQDHLIRYFVDRDFDYLKGHNHGEDIYVTEGYSIENHMVSKDILTKIVSSEFKCCADGDFQALDKTAELFEQFLHQFFEIMEPVNKAIFHARNKGIELKNIEDRVTEYITLSMEGLHPSGKDIFQLIGWPDDHARDTSESDQCFAEIDPHTGWRGKFIFGLFIKTLHLFKTDRTCDNPQLFAKKSGVRFDPNGETVRSFASISSIPASLGDFISSCSSLMEAT